MEKLVFKQLEQYTKPQSKRSKLIKIDFKNTEYVFNGIWLNLVKDMVVPTSNQAQFHKTDIIITSNNYMV